MIAAIIEVVSLLCVLVGGWIWVRRAAGIWKLVGLIPAGIVVLAQVLVTGSAEFGRWYPVALGAMAAAAGLAVFLAIRAPARSSVWPEDPDSL